MKTSICRILVLALCLGCAASLRAEVLIFGNVVAYSGNVGGATVRLVRAPSRAEDFAVAFSEVPLVELARTRSDRDGTFRLSAPEPGFYRIVVEAEGHVGAMEWASVLSSAPGFRKIHLLRARRAELEVRTAEGQAIAGARIRLAFDKPHTGLYNVWPTIYSTDAAGKVALLLPQGEDAPVSIAAPGWALHRATLAAGRERLEARLEAGRQQAIEVVDARGQPLADVALSLPEIDMPIGLTDSAGKAVVHLLPDQQELLFNDADGRSHLAAVPALGSEPAREAAKAWRIELADPQPVRGRVVELDSQKPVADAWVFMESRRTVFTRSDRHGNFELLLPSGRYRRLVSVKEGFHSARANIDESSSPVTLSLLRAARIAGKVVDADRSPVVGAWIEVWVKREHFREEGSRSHGLTDAKGRFLLDRVAAGEPLEIRASFKQLQSPSRHQDPIAAGDEVALELFLPRRETLRCRVVDSEGNPVAGAEVLAREVPQGSPHFAAMSYWRPGSHGMIELGLTDASGRLEVSALSAGTYDLAARARGFGPQLQTAIELGSNESGDNAANGQEVKFVLRPAVPTRGKAVDSNGQPIAGAQIFYALGESARFRSSGSRGASLGTAITTTGPNGEFQFAELAAGQRFSLAAEKEGYVTAFLSDLSPGGEELILTLRAGGRLEGKVSGGGLPLDKVRLRLQGYEAADRLRSPPVFHLARTDQDGNYSIELIEAGEYRLEVLAAPGFLNRQSPSFAIEGGATRRLDVELEKAAVVFGRVLAATGAPVAGATIELGRGKPGHWRYATGHSDSEGRYSIENAEPGQAWLRARSPAYREVFRDLMIEDGRNEVDVILPVGELAISARVLGSDREGLAGAEVRLDGEGETSRQAFSSAEGAVGFTGLEPGSYYLKIEKEGFVFAPRSFEIRQSVSDLEWEMARASGRLKGALLGLDPADAAQLMVVARSAAGFEPVIGTTKLDQYQIEGLAAGLWRVFASSQRRAFGLVTGVALAEGESLREVPLDFNRLGGPWVGQIQPEILAAAGQDRIYYNLSTVDQELLLHGDIKDGRLELRAEPGTYQLRVSLGHRLSKTFEIEIGGPSEHLIELEKP